MLTQEELRNILLLLFMSGLDTVSSTLGQSVQTLAGRRRGAPSSSP